MKTLLWLDDIRNPFTMSDWLLSHSPDYWYEMVEGTHEVIWVKNYDDFVTWIEMRGLPDEIGFDHDLGDGSKSGMDAAKWLVEYCMDNDVDIPDYFIQSANPVGRENIEGLIENFKKHRNGS